MPRLQELRLAISARNAMKGINFLIFLVMVILQFEI